MITAYRGEAALARLAEDRPDVVLLDPGLPDADGVAIIARVRARTDAPIIVVADLRDEAIVVAALETGAMDVVGKPIRVAELIARIHAAVRRGIPTSGVFEPSLDGLRMDLGRREATVAGRSLAVTKIEFELLSVLAARRGDVVDHLALAATRSGSPATGRHQADPPDVAAARGPGSRGPVSGAGAAPRGERTGHSCPGTPG